MRQHKLHPGHVYVTDQSTRIWASLGTGTVVCLRDKCTGRGGMAYYIKPECHNSPNQTPEYGNIAILTLISELLQAGSSLENLEAHIVTVTEQAVGSITSDKNLEVATSLLTNYGIEISSRIMKKLKGKTLSFYVESGRLEIMDQVRDKTIKPSGALFAIFS